MTRDAKPETSGPYTSRDGAGRDSRDGPRDAGHAETGHPGARAQQARDRHDSGAYRDKVGVADPAASPLGTDSEAAGLREPEGSIEPPPAGGVAAEPHGGVPHGHARGEYETGSGRWIWMAAAASVALLLALMVFIIAAF